MSGEPGEKLLLKLYLIDTARQIAGRLANTLDFCTQMPHERPGVVAGFRIYLQIFGRLPGLLCRLGASRFEAYHYRCCKQWPLSLRKSAPTR
jgi:hypothetical protein